MELRRREELNLDINQQMKHAAKAAAEQKEAAEQAKRVRLQKEADDEAAAKCEIVERHRREMEAAAEAEQVGMIDAVLENNHWKWKC